MMFKTPIDIFQRDLIGSLAYSNPLVLLPPGTSPLFNAQSGLSIGPAGTAILGNQVTSINDATLLADSTIPLGTFALVISEIGAGVSSILSPFSCLVLQSDAGNPLSSPQIYITDAGVESGRINFTNEGVSNSIFIGTASGKLYVGGGGGQNTALGSDALNGLTSGARNTAIGWFALGSASLAAGSDNTAVGNLALANNQAAGLVNTAVGSVALTANTTGTRNTAVGFAALNANISGSFNTAVGQECLANQTTGSQNTAVGRNSIMNIVTGTNNAALGNDINVPSAGSSFNVFIGSAAGGVSGPAQVSTNNTFVGAIIFELSPTYGTGNIVMGYNAYSAAGSAIGNNNIMIGQSQSVTGAAITNNNTFIGPSINASTAPVSHSIVIVNNAAGYNIRIPNVVVLGDSTQNTIIGSATNPTDNGNRLQVRGKITTGGAAPLTLGAGAMDFGKVVTAASVLNATQYLEISVDGALVKVCIN
jgi:hypothetical protein